ncbi:MAG: SIS domain-containing protein [Patescibacteria group bacterium]
MMSDIIKKFPTQFAFEPVVAGGKLKRFGRFILSGMGGSHLAADLLLLARPDLPLLVRSDYGLPSLPPKELKKSLLIASSYSGNTEEVIDALHQALKKKMPVVVIAVGGALIDIAKKKKLPYIQLPDTGIQPRSALGFSLRALLRAIGDEHGLKATKALAKTLKPLAFEAAGRALANRLKDHVPLIYASRQNFAIAYNWKIKFNENGKIPAFCNSFPEINHNEMTGFEIQPSSRHLSERFHCIFLRDATDNPRIKRRMDVLKKLYTDRGLPVEEITLSGKNIFAKIFSSLLLVDWAAVATAELYGLESEQVPMLEEFKKMIK